MTNHQPEPPIGRFVTGTAVASVLIITVSSIIGLPTFPVALAVAGLYGMLVIAVFGLSFWYSYTYYRHRLKP